VVVARGWSGGGFDDVDLGGSLTRASYVEGRVTLWSPVGGRWSCRWEREARLGGPGLAWGADPGINGVKAGVTW
jgi:hypothetical protein